MSSAIWPGHLTRWRSKFSAMCAARKRWARLPTRFREVRATSRACSHASRSLLMVPLRAQGRSIGVLSLARHRPESGAYSEEDLKFATAMAERAGMAILNARLYRALEASNEDLERRVADRTAELEAANK